MNETFLLAFVFALLAFAGIQPNAAGAAKVCRVDAILQDIGC